MDFGYSPRVEKLRQRVSAFMDEFVVPADKRWHAQAESRNYPVEVIEPLKQRARELDLWNLFLPALKADEPGTRLSNLEYAPLAEIMGRIPWSAEVFNCNAPDTGNMELLHLAASQDQRQRWLLPLLRGDIRSAFAMTEPEVASSDPTNLKTSIRRQGDQYVVNGRKWFVTGAAHPQCRLLIVMGISEFDPQAHRHARHSMVLVPLDTPGVRIERNLPVMNHYAPEGHSEIVLQDVHIPVANLLGEEGRGFALAQARLGPGRVHHCMRSIGQCELALELMCARALERQAFGRPIAEFSNVREAIARSRIEIDQVRLLVLRAAWCMDREGNAAARTEVSAIKVAAAELQTRVADRAMQVFGAMGLTNDTPLAFLWTWGRALRFIDGPDEVHLQTVAREELARARNERQDSSP
jgi:acyl-CoA dehydrogenase